MQLRVAMTYSEEGTPRINNQKNTSQILFCIIHSLTTLLETTVHLLIHAVIQSSKTRLENWKNITWFFQLPSFSEHVSTVAIS